MIIIKFRYNSGVPEEFGMAVIDHAIQNGVTTTSGLVDEYFGDPEKAAGELMVLESMGVVANGRLYAKRTENIGHYLVLALSPKGEC